MARSPQGSAVVGFVCSLAAFLAMPLSMILVLSLMEFMRKNEATAWTTASIAVLGGILSIVLASFGLKWTSQAKRSELPSGRTGWAIGGVVGYCIPWCVPLYAAVSGLVQTLGKGPSYWRPEALLWLGAFGLVPAVAIAWAVVAVRRHGWTYALLPRLATPSAVIAILLGILGLVAAFPIYHLQRSCGPSVYSFDGKEFVFDCEPYAGAISEPRTCYNRLNHLRPTAQQYQLTMANELDETQYTDELKLLVVDHPSTAEIIPDAAGKLHTLSAPVRPTVAREEPATDILGLIAGDDERYWESALAGRNGGEAPPRRTELVVEFPKPADARRAKLAMRVSNTPWAVSGSAGVLKLLGACGPLMSAVRSQARNGYIRFEVQVDTGRDWTRRGVVRGASPRLPRDEIVVLDIGDVPGERLRLRLPVATGFWRIGDVRVDYGEDVPVSVAELEPQEATDQHGRDLCAVLQDDDQLYYVAEKGDRAVVCFAEPERAAGMARSFILRASGYYTIHAF